MAFKKRGDLHLVRKAWHVGFGLLIAGLYQFYLSRGQMLVFLTAMSGLYLMVELARFRLPALNRFGIHIMKGVIRAGEERHVHGGVAFALSCLVAVLVFPRAVAILSILYLGLGDPFASIFGILFGHRGPRFRSGKTLVGFLAGVLVCVLLTVVELGPLGLAGTLPSWRVFAVALAGGFAAGLAELVPVGIDDNFLVPIFSGLVVWGVM